MNTGMSARFQAASCVAIAVRIAASSTPFPCAHAATHANTKTRTSHARFIQVPPRSAYNDLMAPAAASPFRVVHTVCSHDCTDSCAVLVTVNEQGRAIKVEGDPSQPVTQGFLCGKVAKYLDRVYAPDRILYPLRRKPGAQKGPRPRGQEHEAFERVSWDEALEAIAARLQQISDEHGPESILPYSYAGTIGVLGYGSMDRRFFHHLGASRLDRTICSEAGGQAWNLVYGKNLGSPPRISASQNSSEPGARTSTPPTPSCGP